MSDLDIGFIGLGIMGTAMASNLLKCKLFKSLHIYNRSSSKCEGLAKEGAIVASTAADVVRAADITFAMVSDPAAAQETVFGEGGVLEGIREGKGYVDMSTVDEGTSKEIGRAITARGGKFLEAPVSGSKKPAIDGELIILAAGDASLYEASLPAFDIMGKKSLFLGNVGAGARMKLVVNMVMGSMMGAFSEGLALTERAGLSQADLLTVLGLGAMSNPMFALKGPSMTQRSYPTAFPLKHQQKDLRLALALGDSLNQPLPIAAAANELYKEAKCKGHGDDDFSAVYEATQKISTAASQN